MPQLTISCRGKTPIPWGSSEWEWRRALAEKARSARIGSELKDLHLLSQFEVAVTFLMTNPHIQRADLDNLAKPVLDTLFRSRNAQVSDSSLTGALFDFDDDRVFRLTLEKRSVPAAADEGVDITVSW